MSNIRITSEAGIKALSEALGWYDVRGYGAVGDGATDDTAAIQAAIDSLSNGGIVRLPPYSTFKITSPLLLAQGAESAAGNDVWLQGSGWTSVINNAGTDEAIIIGTTAADRTADVRVKDLMVVGGATTSHGILVNRTHSYRVEGCRIKTNGGDGINLYRAYAGWILDNYINNNTGNGIKGGAYNDFSLILGNKILANGENGVYLNDGDSSGCRIHRNDIEGNTIGIKVDCGAVGNMETLSIVDNYFESQTGKNISLGEDVSASRIIAPLIMGNEIRQGTIDAATNAVTLDRVQFANVIANMFAVDLTVTANTLYYYLNGNKHSGTLYPTGGEINTSYGPGLSLGENFPSHADNAEAVAAGLLPGRVYRTPAGVLMVVYTP